MAHHGSRGDRGIRRPALVILCAALATAGCGQPTAIRSYPSVDGELIRTHHTRLDEAKADGVEPGSRGEQAAAQYLTGVFRDIGLTVETQPVGLTRVKPISTSIKVGLRTLRPGDDFVAWTRRHETTVLADAPVVFMGYGISTPAQGWDDYKDVNVQGKLLLMLIGSPHNGKRNLLGALGADWYGRRRYKFEEAHRRGAAGVLLIRVDDQLDEVPALSWDALKNASTDILGVGTPENPTTHLAVEGWMTPEAAREILSDATLDFDDVKRLAAETNFRAIDLSARAAIEIRNDVGRVTGTNVVATLKGTMPDYVLYSAQWNDLPAGGFTGSDLTDDDPANEPPPGAPILLEVARALARERAAHRTFVFLIVTAGSEGLLGLDYYLKHPVAPLPETRAAIHVAGFTEQTGESQISIIGAGYPGLKDLVHDQAAEQFRVGSGDVDAERLNFFRQAETIYTDKGIPSVFLVSRHVELAGAIATAAAAAPPRADMSVAVLDAQLVFHVGLAVATSNNWPKWTPTRAGATLDGPVTPGIKPLVGIRR